MSRPGKKAALAAASVILAAAVYFVLPPDCPEPARRTASVFIFAALFWALQLIPLFATSLLVILSLIFLLAQPDGVLGMRENGYQIFMLPFSSPVIMLFLGGFVLAKMLQKYRIDHAIAEQVLRRLGHKPYFVLCSFMGVTAFLSLWMSHTAATALMLAMIAPVLLKLDADDTFKKALVLAIPFAANIGGIGTPVGTPPNAIALGILAEHGIQVRFLDWMAMALPLAAILLAFASLVLYFMFPPKHKDVPIRFEKAEQLDRRALGAAGIAVLTVLMWLTSGWHGIPESLTSLLAVGLFAALGFLKREDINSLHWDILILMWGGLALGEAMELSGLGKWVVSLPLFSQEGFALAAIFCLVTVAVSIVVSNTPTANLIVPLALSVPGENQAVLAVIVALSCSFDMLLPVSTPSNALAFSTRVISTADMMKSGAVIVAAAVALLLLGYPFFIGRMF